jgi:hypothetical protein
MLRRMVATLAAAFLLAAMSVVQPAVAAGLTWDGLQQVRSKRMDEAYLRSGADFRGYHEVMLDSVTVSFKRNWERDVRSSVRSVGPFLTAQDVDRIRRDMADGLRAAMTRDLTKAGYRIVDHPGPGVLRLTPVLLDVYVNAPDVQRDTRVDVYTLEAGEATLAIETRDSQTNELLGRAVDRRRTGETGTWTWTTRVSNRAEFGRIFSIWSSIIVDGLEALKEASPVAAPASQK